MIDINGHALDLRKMNQKKKKFHLICLSNCCVWQPPEHKVGIEFQSYKSLFYFICFVYHMTVIGKVENKRGG